MLLCFRKSDEGFSRLTEEDHLGVCAKDPPVSLGFDLLFGLGLGFGGGDLGFGVRRGQGLRTGLGLLLSGRGGGRGRLGFGGWH